MIVKHYQIFTAQKGSFDQSVSELIQKIVLVPGLVKITFFGSPGSNTEYLEQREKIRFALKESFAEFAPLMSYVAQKPLIGVLTAEVVSLQDVQGISIRREANYFVLVNHFGRELVTEGILPQSIDQPFGKQANEVFAEIATIMQREGFDLNSIVRQWNYIEQITGFDGDQQHYQAFNDARTKFYHEVEWRSGYPAATGIGTQRGGVMVEIDAFEGPELINLALDNPLQISAHRYSNSVLVGAADPCLEVASTPKFERARVVGEKHHRMIFVSGTAAIRGEESERVGDVVWQTKLTMENIDCLTSNENYPCDLALHYKVLRVYIKNPEDLDPIRNFLDQFYPEVSKIYICADVCREELLVEIEGIAELK